jgi:hypothetical protein
MIESKTAELLFITASHFNLNKFNTGKGKDFTGA